MWKKWGVFVALLAWGWTLGCGYDTTDDDIPDMPEGVSTETGLALSIDFQGGTDVAGFEFVISQCGGDEVLREQRDLEDLVLPGMIPEFDNDPFDEHSRHLFADYFTTLEAGCYDVQVQPLDDQGQASADCTANTATEVQVIDGLTTEILLVSQCNGPSTGALDVVAAMNHPPIIESVHYSPSKFAFECEEVEVCVTVFEPNDDPLEFVFEQTGGQRLWVSPEVTSIETQGDRTTACMMVVPVWNDNYEFKVTVFDLFWKDGQQVRVEDHVEGPSRAELTFPVYSNWDIELHCYDPGTDSYHAFEGVREIQRHSGCVPIWPFQFYCDPNRWDDTDTTCPDGVFKPETVYPLCEDHGIDPSAN